MIFFVCVYDKVNVNLMAIERELSLINFFYLNNKRVLQNHTLLLGNTRVVTQTALQTFQDEMGKVMKDPYKVVMKQTKLPISLLNEKAKVCLGTLMLISFCPGESYEWVL